MEAIIAVSGSQYRVEEGSVLEVFPLPGAAVGKQIKLHPVAAIDGTEILTGKKELAKITVVCTVAAEKKGEKVYVYKRKAKTGYHRGIGHRDRLVVLKVEKINDGRA